MRSHFSSFLLLHSNSQMANVLSSPAKNSSGISTSKPFTAFGSVNGGLSDTWGSCETIDAALTFEEQWSMAEESHSTLSQCKHHPILHFMRPGMDKKLLLSNGVPHKEAESVNPSCLRHFKPQIMLTLLKRTKQQCTMRLVAEQL